MKIKDLILLLEAYQTANGPDTEVVVDIFDKMSEDTAGGTYEYAGVSGHVLLEHSPLVDSLVINAFGAFYENTSPAYKAKEPPSQPWPFPQSG